MTKRWPELVVRSTWDLPVEELSGLVFDSSRQRLLAVGDAAATLLHAPWTDDGPGDWSTVDLTAAGVAHKHSQLEAVGIGPDGSVVIVTEDPACIFVLADDGGCQLRIELADVAGTDDLVGGGSGIEGVAASPGGGLLLAREKEPVLLAELGGLDGEPEVLARWTLGGDLGEAFDDVSDLEATEDGLWLLSDQSATVALVSELPAAGGTMREAAIARLPALHGKPEGLAVLADGRILVGLDRKRARDNVVLLDPPPWLGGPE